MVNKTIEEEQGKMINDLLSKWDGAVDGWRKTLREWGKSNLIWFFQSLLNLVGGILIGLGIAGVWR